MNARSLVNLKKGGLFFYENFSRINKVKAEYMGKLLLLKIGAFYIALGIDAYILHEILGLKLTDISNVKKDRSTRRKYRKIYRFNAKL